MRKCFLLLPFLLLQTLFAGAQIKYEKEYRLKEYAVPEAAKDFVSALEFSRKIKWYKEESLNRTSVEAKTKHEGKHYSVEFNNEGDIEDIEIIIKHQEIETEARAAMCEYFNENYQKYKIAKIQLQLSGDPEVLIMAVKKKKYESSEHLKINYEIIAKVKKEKAFEKAEFLFDESGQLLQKSVIVLKNTDNLEY